LKKILLTSCLFSALLSADLSILNQDKKKLRELEKQIIEQNYQTSKYDWVSPINLNGGLSRTHSFSNESDKFIKSVSIGFTQSIYKSGGIEFSIKYANDKSKADRLLWENENSTILQNIYETVLNISKINLQIQQSEYKLQNKEIELVLKKVQYEAGKTDIIELNNAIMDKNSEYKNNINLKNSLSQEELELSKYTDLKYQEIDILDFSTISKDNYLQDNINLLYENALVDVLNSTYKKLKSSYLPNVTLSSSLSYSNSDDLINDDTTDSTSGSIAVNFSMPLYDYNKNTALAKSKIEVLKQKVNVESVKKEIEKDFEVALSKIDTYKQYNKIINDNLKLYDDLITINESSNKAGMSATYDLDILKNTKKINQYDLAINTINMQQEYAKLYFKTKVNN